MMHKMIPVKSCLFAASVALTLMLSACGPGKDRLHADVSKTIQSPVTIHRYDLDLFRVDIARLQNELESLRPTYRFFLGTDLGDPGKLADMKSYLESPRNTGFHDAVASRYQHVSSLEKELTEAFRHYRYYFPHAASPRVYAYISGGDYDYPVQFADSVMLIGLDNYLGKDFKPYISDGLPFYRIMRMNEGDILPDCMKVLSTVTYPGQVPGNNLLEQMIEAGKRLYFVDAMIPAVPDRFKISYTQEQYDWIVKNEAHVWAAIIENRMLYTTDPKLIRTFISDGPFTAGFAKEAPPRLGEWLGWQIVRKFMENETSVTLDEMMKERDFQKILSASRFKPEK